MIGHKLMPSRSGGGAAAVEALSPKRRKDVKA